MTTRMTSKQIINAKPLFTTRVGNVRFSVIKRDDGGYGAIGVLNVSCIPPLLIFSRRAPDYAGAKREFDELVRDEVGEEGLASQ